MGGHGKPHGDIAHQVAVLAVEVFHAATCPVRATAAPLRTARSRIAHAIRWTNGCRRHVPVVRTRGSGSWSGAHRPVATGRRDARLRLTSAACRTAAHGKHRVDAPIHSVVIPTAAAMIKMWWVVGKWVRGRAKSRLVVRAWRHRARPPIMPFTGTRTTTAWKHAVDTHVSGVVISSGTTVPEVGGLVDVWMRRGARIVCIICQSARAWLAGAVSSVEDVLVHWPLLVDCPVGVRCPREELAIDLQGAATVSADIRPLAVPGVAKATGAFQRGNF